jgi:glutamate synthase domain-containing protein 2
MRREFVWSVAIVLLVIALIAFFYRPILWSMALIGPLIVLGFRDYTQTKHAVLRNFPVIGHFRYLLETIRPEIQQYFIENDTDGMPFGRDERSLVYQRAKQERDTIPFGTLEDVYKVGYEWVNHSIVPIHVDVEDMRVMVGGPACKQPPQYFGDELWFLEQQRRHRAQPGRADGWLCP